jgi:hypothetical protein
MLLLSGTYERSDYHADQNIENADDAIYLMVVIQSVAICETNQYGYVLQVRQIHIASPAPVV